MPATRRGAARKAAAAAAPGATPAPIPVVGEASSSSSSAVEITRGPLPRMDGHSDAAPQPSSFTTPTADEAITSDLPLVPPGPIAAMKDEDRAALLAAEAYCPLIHCEPQVDLRHELAHYERHWYFSAVSLIGSRMPPKDYVGKWEPLAQEQAGVAAAATVATQIKVGDRVAVWDGGNVIWEVVLIAGRRAAAKKPVTSLDIRLRPDTGFVGGPGFAPTAVAKELLPPPGGRAGVQASLNLENRMDPVRVTFIWSCADNRAALEEAKLRATTWAAEFSRKDRVRKGREVAIDLDTSMEVDESTAAPKPTKKKAASTGTLSRATKKRTASALSTVGRNNDDDVIEPLTLAPPPPNRMHDDEVDVSDPDALALVPKPTKRAPRPGALRSLTVNEHDVRGLVEHVVRAAGGTVELAMKNAAKAHGELMAQMIKDSELARFASEEAIRNKNTEAEARWAAALKDVIDCQKATQAQLHEVTQELKDVQRTHAAELKATHKESLDFIKTLFISRNPPAT